MAIEAPTLNYREVDVLRAIDADRTLLKTRKALDEAIKTGASRGLVDKATVNDARAKVESTGGSFNFTSHLLKSGITYDEISGLYRDFGRQPNPDLLYPDVPPLLERLKAQNLPWFIHTVGDVDWQTAKLNASGLGDYPRIITSKKYKGEEIASWYDGRRYRIALDSGSILVAQTVGLIDDKKTSFRGLPADCWGRWLRRPGCEELPSQEGVLMPNVYEIAGLDEA